MAGAATGYMTKVIQALASLWMVPVLIGADNIGLAGYGVIATFQALQALLALPLDGWRLAVARAVSLWLNRGVDITRPTSAVSLIVSLCVACAALSMQDSALRAVGLDAGQRETVPVVVAVFLVGQVAFNFEQLFHARGTTWLVNVGTSAEAVIRAVCVTVAVYTVRPSVWLYFVITLAVSVVKLAMYAWGRRAGSGQEAVAASALPGRRELEIAKYALPLSYKGLSAFVVYRGTVLAANRFLGAEAAALMSLLVVTVRNMIAQAFLAAIRPMAIPVAARIDLNAMSAAAAMRWRSYQAAFLLALGTILLPVSLTVGWWLPLWTRTPSLQIDTWVKVMLLAMAVEAMSSLGASVLVAQGHGRPVSNAAVVSGLVFLCTLIGAIAVGSMSEKGVYAAFVIYQVLYFVVLLPLIARRRLRTIYDGSEQRSALLLLAAGTVAAMTGAGMNLGLFLQVTMAMGLFLIGFTRFVMPISEMRLALSHLWTVGR